MTDIDQANDPHFQYKEDVTNEDRFVRLSKHIAEEIITVQTRLISLEKRNDDPATQHEIELLNRQIKTLEGRKEKYDFEISELQNSIHKYHETSDCRVNLSAQVPSNARPLASKPNEKLIDTLRRKNTERALSTPAKLPIWPEAVRGVPNGILRSALFGAVKRGKRRYMERESIAAVDGIDLIYTGPRLDQADLDVLEGALHLARLITLGNRIEFTEKSFLKLIGRGGEGGENIGKSDR